MGVVASGIAFAIQIWVIEKAGPVFLSVYLPVQTLLVAVIASIALGEEFFLGGFVGAAMIMTGLYLVLWGKSEESKFASISEYNEGKDGLQSSSLVQPLLHTASR